MSKAYLKTSIGGFFFDVIFKETYVYTNEITKNPVQSGAAVNDHVYSQPIEVTFDVGVSDCLASIIAGQFSSFSSRAASAHNTFYTLWRGGIPLEINTYFGNHAVSYKDMVIRSITVVKDKTTMNALHMTVVMQQVIKTNATTMGVTDSGGSTGGKANGKATSADPNTTDQSGQTTVIGKAIAAAPETAGVIVDSAWQGLLAIWNSVL